MLPQPIVAVFLTLTLVVVAVRNFYWSRKSKNVAEPKPARNEPVLTLSTLGLMVFVVELIAFPVLLFLGYGNLWMNTVLQLSFNYDYIIQIIGVVVMLSGAILAFWSLHQLNYGNLTTQGLYRYVRHPQYLGFFMVFIGFFFTMLNVLALIPMIIIPGQAHVATIEEAFLQQKYKDAYDSYRMRTGKFLPKISSTPSKEDGTKLKAEKP